jgi:homoaconitase/3-isopropylmalate dehydratase large subunit
VIYYGVGRLYLSFQAAAGLLAGVLCLLPAHKMTIVQLCAAGKNGIIAPDQTTFDYVDTRTSDKYEPVYSDGGANYIADYK